MTTASRSLATALRMGALRERLAPPSCWLLGGGQQGWDELTRKTCVVGLWRRLQGAFRAGGGTAVAVSVSCAIKLLQRWRRTGSVAPDPRGRKPYALADHEGLVRELVAARPDMTLDELHEELGRRGIRVGRSSIGRFLLARAG